MQILQKLLGTLAVTAPAKMPSNTITPKCCDITAAVDFIAPSCEASPTWRYYAGVNDTTCNARNWITNMLGSGVSAGGGVASVYTDHGAGAIFWLAGGGKYDHNWMGLNPATAIIREKMVAEINPRLREIVLDAIGGPQNFENVVGIPEIAYFPEDNADILARLISHVTDHATYSIIYPDATSLGINDLLESFPEWKLVDTMTIGKGNTSIHGFPEENGPGLTNNVWMYGV